MVSAVRCSTFDLYVQWRRASEPEGNTDCHFRLFGARLARLQTKSKSA